MRSHIRKLADHPLTVGRDDLVLIYKNLKILWCARTSENSEQVYQENPYSIESGQAAVTSILIHRIFGGKIMKGTVIINDEPFGIHYWNKLQDKQQVDFTCRQFNKGVMVRDVSTRKIDDLLSCPNTRKRYELLARRCFNLTHNEEFFRILSQQKS